MFELCKNEKQLQGNNPNLRNYKNNAILSNMDFRRGLDMKVEFDIKLTTKDMYQFSMYHAYTGSQGILSVIIAGLCIGAAVTTYGSVTSTYTGLYLLFGVLFLFYLPVNLYLRSKRQFLLGEALQKPLHYKIDDTGIHTSQGELTGELPWDMIYKIVATKRSVLIYSSRVNAYILPRTQIEQYYTELKALVKEYLPNYRYKMK